MPSRRAIGSRLTVLGGLAISILLLRHALNARCAEKAPVDRIFAVTDVLPHFIRVCVLQPSNTFIVVATNGVLWKLPPHGAATRTGTAPFKDQIRDIVCDRDADGVYVTNSRQIARSDNLGTTWEISTLAEDYPSISGFVQGTADHSVVAIGYANWWRTAAGHMSWSPIQNPTKSHASLVIPVPNTSTLIALDKGGKVEVSVDNGANFSLADSVAENLTPAAAIAIPNKQTVLTVGDYNEIWRASNLAKSWQRAYTERLNIPESPGPKPSLRAIARDPLTGVLYVAGTQGLLMQSTDTGRTWKKISLTGHPLFGALNAIAVSRNGDTIAAVGDMSTVARSYDHGKSWEVDSLTYGSELRTVAVTPDGRSSVAVGDHGIQIRSLDGGLTWTRGTQKTDADLHDVVNALDSRTLVAGGAKGLILRSEDTGETWESQIPTELAGHDVGALVRLEHLRCLVALLDNPQAIAVSRDDGRSWHLLHGDFGPSDRKAPYTDAFEASWMSDLFVATGAGLLRVDLTTYAVSRVWPANDWANLVSAESVAATQTLFVGNRDGKVFRSTDGGKTWTASLDRQNLVWGLGSISASPDGQRLFASERQGSGSYLSFDAGRTWHYYQSRPSPTYGAWVSNGMILGYLQNELGILQSNGLDWVAVYPVGFSEPTAAEGQGIVSGAVALPPKGSDRQIIAVGQGIKVLKSSLEAPSIESTVVSQSLTGTVSLQVTLRDPNQLCERCLELYGRSDTDYASFERERNLRKALVLARGSRTTWTAQVDPHKQLSAQLGDPVHIEIRLQGPGYTSVKELVFPYGVSILRQRVTIAAISLAGATLLLICVYLWKPLWLLALGSRVAAIEKLSTVWPSAKPVVELFLAVGLFPWISRLPRVIDAWLMAHREAFEGSFRRDAVETWLKANSLMEADLRSRGLEVPPFYPFSIEIPGRSEFAGDQAIPVLRDVFCGANSKVYVVGSGGTGKTSFAITCVRWARNGLLFKTPTQSIWMDEDTSDPLSSVTKRIRQIVDDERLPEYFILAALKTKRILVIVDRLSEKSETTEAAWSQILPSAVGALLVTMRSAPKRALAGSVTMQILPLAGKRMLGFLEYQLALYDTHKRLENAGQIGTVAHRLGHVLEVSDEGPASLTGAAAISTPLLARLFAQEAVRVAATGQLASGGDALPASIPEVFSKYLVSLNPDSPQAENRLPDHLMLRSVRVLAVSEMADDFLPKFIRRDVAEEALKAKKLPTGRGKEEPDPIRRLEENGVLRAESALGAVRIRFALDPVAEYLAALEIAEACGGNLDLWKKQLAKLNETDKDRDPVGFRTALWVTYLATREAFRLPIIDQNDFQRPTAPRNALST